jgi:hypothetical protein
MAKARLAVVEWRCHGTLAARQHEMISDAKQRLRDGKDTA